MKKTITFFKRSILAVVLILVSVNAWSQTPSNGGFENGSTNWTLSTATAVTTASIGAFSPRTGVNNLKIVHTAGTESVAKFQNNANSIPVAIDDYVYIIGWMANSTTTNGKACFGGAFVGGTSSSPSTVAVTTTTYSRYTYKSNKQTASGTVTPYVKTNYVTGATTITVDDVIMYTSKSQFVDIAKPTTASNITNTLTTTSSASFDWTNGSDTGTGATGVQNTIILRTTNIAASAPTLNDQAIYSVAGGTTGPNIIGDWTVMSTSVASGANTYIDNTCASGTSYLYAVVHRDMAYNYSVALVSSAISTASNDTPTKLLITSITPSNPVFGSEFSVTVQAQTEAGIAANVTSDTEITLTLASGTGSLGGTITGTITSGTNSITITGVSYDTAETGVSITASTTTGMTLAAATSDEFTVVEAVPTTKTSGVTLVSKTSSEISLSWTNGSGAGRIAVARLSATPAVAPTAGTVYTSNSTSFTDGLNSTTGTGNIVIYNGTGSSVTVTDLTSSTGYVVDIYEYSSNTNVANYTTTTALGYTPTFAVEPTLQASDIVFSNVTATTMTIACTAGDGTGRIIVVKAGGAVDASPVDGTYITSPNATFGSGTQLGTGNYVVSRTTNTVNITGLSPITTYHVSVWEYNGSQAPTNYLLTSPATASQATLSTLSVATNANLSSLPICPTCDVIINNGATLTVDADKTYNSITVAAGGKLNNDNASTTTLTIDGDLVIESDASGTGTYVEKQNGALSVSGTTTVKQYLAADRNYYVSSAVSNAPAPGGLNYYKYLEAGNNPANPLVAPATLYWASVAAGETLNPAMGYIARPTGETTLALATATGGNLNTGDKTTETLTRTALASKPGFNLVGNPYPSYLDMSSFENNAVIMPSIWYRSKNGATWGFDTYNIPSALSTGVSGFSVTSLVPPMQAFWVRLKSDVTSGTLTFTNDMRAHKDENNNKFRAPKANNATQQVVRLQLSNGTVADEAVVYFNQNASDSFDRFDSPKMLNDIATAPEIYTLVGAERFAINGLNSIPAESNVAIGLRKGTANQFTMRISELKNMDSNTRIILIDSKENKEHDMTEGSVYSFDSDEATTNSRFSLAFRSPSVATGLQTENATRFTVKNIGNQLVINSTNARNAKVILYNAVGQKLIETVSTGDKTVINHALEAGVYIVTLEVVGTKRSEKIILN